MAGEAKECNMAVSQPALGETHGCRTVARKPKVLLVEDSGLLVERLRELFAQMQGVDLVGHRRTPNRRRSLR